MIRVGGRRWRCLHILWLACLAAHWSLGLPLGRFLVRRRPRAWSRLPNTRSDERCPGVECAIALCAGRERGRDPARLHSGFGERPEEVVRRKSAED